MHASTEDWTNTDLLLEGIGIFLSLYFAKAACTASVCKSKRAHRHRLAWIMNTNRTRYAYTHDYQIGIAHPGCYLPGTCCVWLLGEELGRRIWSCCQFAEKDLSLQKWPQNGHNLQYFTDYMSVKKLLFYSEGVTVLRNTTVTQPVQASQSLMIILYIDWFLLIL